MSTRVVERVDDWTERPFSGGYRELQDLADSAFSGVVRAGGAELFMTKGVVVGIRRGSIDDFEESSGTIFDAPTDALPLLAIMQERSDEVRAKYYSEDTGISEVDQTLESGGFTGFVELSENVLSGDYYLVYHQGTSMSVAFVGNTEQLLTDDEAFERANDEVGIYEVRPVDIEPVEIPEPPEPEPDPEPDPVAGAVPDEESAEDDPVSVEDNTPPESVETVVEPDPTESDGPETGSDPLSSEESSGAPTVSTERHDDADESDPGQADGVPDESTDTPATDPVTEPSTVERDDGPAKESQVAKRQSADTTPAASPRPEPTEREPSASDRADVRTGESATPETGGQESETTSATTDTDTGTGQAAAAETEPAPPREQEPVETPAQQDVPSTPISSESGQSESAANALDERAVTEDPSSLETRAIPSLDPELTSSQARSSPSEPRRDAPARDDERRASAGGSTSRSTEHRDQSAERRNKSPNGTEQPTDRHSQQTTQESTANQEERQTKQSTAQSTGTAESTESTEQTAEASEEREEETGVSERIEELQELLTERETEIDRLESSLDTAESERESVRRELEQVREERDELETEVEKLESELQRLEEELGAATDAQQRMTPQEALSGTDIFVRYRSKGDATLEKAHQSGAVKKDVVENLRLEKHTQFDADISAVGGREYDEFLEDTVAYRFVRWVVEDLIFEIQGTGHTDSLSELYDALPKINRVELNGAVNVTYTEDGQETQTAETFDVVFRERMGDPLLVANINESRQGASEAMMEGLITAAERVGQTSDQLGSAFLVTESFFEPEALETVAEATRGGILSRDKRKSFVNLSRKRGYHLCLVEARNQNFHLEVPEL